ncbi:MAG: hypothetical protein ACYDHN_04590, partial [Solirubrobacteraceae bacterium]
MVSTVGSVSGVTSASAAQQRSNQVALVPGPEGEGAGTLQTFGEVTGSSGNSFDQFNFTDVPLESLEPGILSSYDTVVLNEVFTSSLTESEKQALSSFVTGGGKLIIHDADGTVGNDYSWLPVPAGSGQACQNCGNLDGMAEIVENNTVVSADPSSPYYVDVAELPGNSDAVGDANFLLTNDPRWSADITGSNSLNIGGAIDAYATDGGLILYNGFDTDFLGGTFPSGNDWLNKIWYDELSQQWDPDNLPHSVSVVGSGGHCGYRSIRVGVVTVCAEQLNINGSNVTATGNVVLDGGVAVGAGPLEIDTTAKQLSLPQSATISLLRKGGSISLGTGAFAIDANGATDPVSGKSGLAKVSLTGADFSPLAALRAGSLPFSLPLTGSLTMYLDNANGGGLVGAGSVSLPMLGSLKPSGALSLGLYAGSAHPVEPLGGAAQFGAIDFGKGWKFEGLSLSYQQASDTWTASGGLAVPVGSLHAEGSVIAGGLDSLQVAIGGQNIPLGDSGFFFSGFGGGFSGLVHGPLKIDASTEGYWGVPKAPVEPFYLDKVTVTLSFGGSIALDGAVSFALQTHSPLTGHLHLRLGVNPFSAVGTASEEGKLPGIKLKAGGGAGFSAKHFTVSENGSISAFSLSGGGQVILSDKGVGGSGELCAPHHWFCQSMAFTETWKQLESFDPPTIVGAEPQKLVTVSGVASAGRVARVRVASGRSLLLLDVTSKTGAPEIRLRAPGGRIYSSTRSTRSVLFTREPQFGLTTVAVPRPRGGIWQIIEMPGDRGALRIR